VTTPERLGTRGLLGWTGIIVLTLYLVFLGGGWVGIHSTTLRSTSLVLTLLVLAAWGIVAIRDSAWRPRSRILPALLVPLGVLAVTTATSRNPRLGLDYVGWSALLVALYLLLVRLMASPYFRGRVLGLGAALAAIVGIWYLQSVAVSWIQWWGLVGRFAAPPLRPEFASLTFGNPSAVMTVSILLTLPAVAFVGWRTRWRALISGALLLLALACTILSGSRAGWIGLAIGLTIAAVAWLLVAENRAFLGRAIRSRSLRIAIGGVALAGIAAGAVLLPGLLVRAGAGGEGLRLAYAQAALRMFAESPLVGTGPGTWVAQRIAYTDVPANDFYIPHAHNIYVQVLAESGLVGAAAGVVVAFFIGRLVLRAIRSSDPSRRGMGWVAVLGLAYFGAHQLLDFYANFPPALFAIAIPIAWLDAAEEAERPPRAVSIGGRSWRLIQLGWAIGAPAVVLLAAGWLWTSESRAALQETAVDALNAGRYADALEPARIAAAADPDMPAAWFTLGVAAAASDDPGEAATAFQVAAEADDLPASWLGLAAARAGLGDSHGARDALARALRLGRGQLAILVAAADLETQLGGAAGAEELYAEALRMAPSLAGDPTLQDRPELRDRWVGIVDAAMDALGPSPEAAEIALEAGRTERLDEIVATFDPATRDLWMLVRSGWDGDPQAIETIRARARAQPFSQRLFVWAARLTARQGNARLADTFRDWARIVNGSNVDQAWETRVTSELPPGRVGAGSESLFYGHYTYRRPTPWEMLPPGLDHLILE
jgi:putative inorganic carbon (HCO3(-)) transporter